MEIIGKILHNQKFKPLEIYLEKIIIQYPISFAVTVPGSSKSSKSFVTLCPCNYTACGVVF